MSRKVTQTQAMRVHSDLFSWKIYNLITPNELRGCTHNIFEPKNSWCQHETNINRHTHIQANRYYLSMRQIKSVGKTPKSDLKMCNIRETAKNRKRCEKKTEWTKRADQNNLTICPLCSGWCWILCSFFLHTTRYQLKEVIKKISFATRNSQYMVLSRKNNL